MNESKFKNTVIGILIVVVIIMGLVIMDMMKTNIFPVNKFKEDSLKVELLKSSAAIQKLQHEVSLKDSLLQYRIASEETTITNKHNEIIHHIRTLSPDSSIWFLSGWISKDTNN